MSLDLTKNCLAQTRSAAVLLLDLANNACVFTKGSCRVHELAAKIAQFPSDSTSTETAIHNLVSAFSCSLDHCTLSASTGTSSTQQTSELSAWKRLQIDVEDVRELIVECKRQSHGSRASFVLEW
jgi:hypothetical protein